MSVLDKQKLLQLVPEGVPATRSWLMEQHKGLTRHTLDNLIKREHLTLISNGVYKRPDTTIAWEAVVVSLQNILATDLAVGGMTALEIKGLTHYVPMSSKRQIHLYGKDKLPKWVNTILPDVEFIHHTTLNGLNSTGLVCDQYDAGLKKLFSTSTHSQPHMNNVWPFNRSSPERAFLEILKEVPDKTSFEHADQLIQGLTILSPRKLNTLLKQSQNIKVRRLFYWFADRHQHAWLHKLSAPNTLDDRGLGSGKRTLVKGGKLDTKYNITVPEKMWTPTANTTDKSSS